ncbi:MAG: hypothetical protein U5L05_10695 [Rubrivivax sp.]|nr:hypothetical protein [Rubrivivax sp.]
MRRFTQCGATIMVVAVLTGCYVVPERAPDGTLYYQHYPLPPAGTVVPGPPPPSRTGPATLPVRLYPSNDIATRSGVITGSVTNMMTGKGVFNVSYQGEVLTGEATRVSNEERRGVASAFSPQGMFMSCEYQMNTPYQGAGTCTFSNGAAYQMHIGGAQQ